MVEALPSRIGPYRLVERIAIGGMAEVYRALAPQRAGGDRAVVVKRLLPPLAETAGHRALFEQEARLGRWIQHPNVVALLDSGVDGDCPFLVLEYVFGVDLWRLSRWLRQGGQRIPSGLAAFIACELLAGLEAVHEARDEAGRRLALTHFDVSPSNLFLSVHGHVKLGDLGIARPGTPAGDELAPSGTRTKGKLGYLAPEQVRGERVDQRADLFSAAVVIAELFLNRPLFEGPTEIGVLLAIRDGDLGALREGGPRVPRGMVEALETALTVRPADRVRSASALRDRLRPFLDDDPAVLRDELGGLVVEAMDALEAGLDRTSLAQTVEEGLDTEPPFAAPPPPEEPPYHVRDRGREHGPWPLARLLAALQTGEVTASAEVWREDEGVRRLTAAPELSRYLPPPTRTPTEEGLAALGSDPDVHDLAAPGGLLPVLGRLAAARASGLLVCARDDTRKEVYLEAGVPTYVTSNRSSELLGAYLVREGILEAEELETALALLPRHQGQLGESLVSLGLVDPVRLIRHLAAQVRSKLVDLFGWTDGDATFYPGVEAPERAFRLDLDAWKLLVEGAGWRVREGLTPELDAFHDGAPVARGPADADGLELPYELEALRFACAGPRVRGELAGIVGPDASVDALVLVLLHLGVLAPWRPPPLALG